VLSSTSPQFWLFWMGIFLVVLALVGRERLAGGARGLVARMMR
jgi:branched-chain amino acid transport system permease protein